MCGIAGILSKSDRSQKAQDSKLILNHRGPDAAAVATVQLPKYQLNLTHNRLAIVDLHEHSNQPFWDDSNSFCLAFNGEIYNYLEIRQELQNLGIKFKTNSDTEVLLNALIHWPAEKALNRLNGMWAFAFLDKKNERILISRDRFGKKPFYYYNIGSELYWASEIKYILKTSQHKFEINPAPVAAYLQQFLLETNEAETFFKEILKLPPGTFAWLDLKKDTLTLEPQKFYHFPIKEDSQVTPQRAQDELQFLIQDSVKIRLRSDVNVGFLLSGGLDSSLLSGVGCSLMPDSKEILKFLSVVSDNPAYDESYFIKKVENHLGIESQRINISHAPQSVFDQLSKVQWHNDEPITSLSAVTYYLMMEKAKELDTKVLISGQGADEIFCGYRKYLGFYVKALLQQKRPIKAFTTLLHFLKTRNLISEFDIGELKRYVSLLNMGSPSVLSNSLKGQPQPFIGLADKTLSERQLDDLFTFSVPALLHYEDRLSMASEREVRAPFLDYRIAEFGINLPMDFKLKDGWSKLILRKIANSYLPKDITWRSDKRGFTIPQELWFKNELRNQIETLLKGDCLIYQMNFVKKEVLLDKFSRYCDGGDKSKLMSFKEIFTPIALENWLQVYKDYLK